jgi:hypothetical protein
MAPTLSNERLLNHFAVIHRRSCLDKLAMGKSVKVVRKSF